MHRSRRSTDPYLCSPTQRLHWHVLAPAALMTYALLAFLALSLSTGYLLGSGPLRQQVQVSVPVPGPTVTIAAPAAP